VGLTKGSTPVTSPDGDNGKFGEDDSASNGSGDFLRALDTKSDVAIEITDSNESLEACSLTGTGLLLDGHDLHDFILQFGEEHVNDLVFLNGEREEVDFFHGLDLAILYETAEFRDGNPVRAKL